MDNLRKAIEILFCKQEPQNVLEQCLSLDYPQTAIDKDWFKQTFLAEHGPYSGNQANQLYNLLTQNWLKSNNYASVFNVLFEFDKNVLRIKDEDPICRYENYLRWHELTALVGEDLLTCSFLAKEDLETFNQRKNFAWNLVLESDNTQLECLFQKGLTELHFHLKGGGLVFDTNWMAIMNEPLSLKESLFNGCNGSQLFEYTILAAYIRLYLFLSVNQIKESDRFIKTFRHIWYSNNRLSLIHFYLNDLQAEIGTQSMLRRHRFKGRTIDYAIPTFLSKRDEKEPVCQFIVGERRLMYQCFQNIYLGDSSVAGLPYLFYLYLIIKIRIKDLLVQDDKIKGFENFKRFDSNKEKFVENARNKAYKSLIPQTAVHSYQKNSHIEYFEFRITPESSPSSIQKKLNQLKPFFDTDNKPHCILHFIKNPDQNLSVGDEFLNAFICRNSKERKQYQQIAGAIEVLLRKNEQCIVGIDAANSEFGCRPEVFAEVYRRLQHLQRDCSLDMLLDHYHKDLGITFHVGEDFYDVADGLRAIEEAVLFLNLTDGARLGHATALGIDASKYYGDRKNTIIIPKHDLLDNCVWLLAKMDQYSIQDTSRVRDSLISAFQRLANELYPNTQFGDYRVYHQAWLLRGDNPYLYLSAKEPKVDLINTSKFMLNHFNKQIDLARKNLHACELYNKYHFNPSTKSKGSEPEEFRCPNDLFAVIAKIQEKMREEIARKKIAIEVNPTSNLRICNIDTYDTHPILKFRNYGLTTNEPDDCPQISVSINTDDKGIFATSLEKEYTLMALAVEKMKDANGKAKYKPNDILAWLNDIREQSITQRFAK